MTKVVPQIEIHRVVLRLKPVIHLTDDQLFELCQLNGDWRIEYTAQGELIVMPPTGGKRATAISKLLSNCSGGRGKTRAASLSIQRVALSSPTAPCVLPMPPGLDARAWWD